MALWVWEERGCLHWPVIFGILYKAMSILLGSCIIHLPIPSMRDDIRALIKIETVNLVF